MKKFLAVLFSLCCVFALTLPVFADEVAEKPCTIQVGLEKETLDLRELPRQPYRESDVLMVPLRLIAEALGYRVGWDAQTGAITVDDDYIQKATLYSGATEVVFEGHLKVIDMSRTAELSAAAVFHDVRTYVPLTFFTEFLNDVSEEDGVILVAPSMCTLDAA